MQQQGDPDVLAPFEGEGQGQEAAAGHQVAGIGVGAGQVEVKQSSCDPDQHHRERADQEQRGEPARGEPCARILSGKGAIKVEGHNGIIELAKGRLCFFKAAEKFLNLPSRP